MSARARRRDDAASAAVFAALGEPARLRIVDRLCNDGPQSIARGVQHDGFHDAVGVGHIRNLLVAYSLTADQA